MRGGGQQEWQNMTGASEEKHLELLWTKYFTDNK